MKSKVEQLARPSVRLSSRLQQRQVWNGGAAVAIMELAMTAIGTDAEGLIPHVATCAAQLARRQAEGDDHGDIAAERMNAEPHPVR